MDNFSGSVVGPRQSEIVAPSAPKQKTKLTMIVIIVEVVIVLIFLIVFLVNLFNSEDGSFIPEDNVATSTVTPVGSDADQDVLIAGLSSSASYITYNNCVGYGRMFNDYIGSDIFPFMLCSQNTVTFAAQETSIPIYQDTSFYQLGIGDKDHFYAITLFNDKSTIYSVSYGATNDYETKVVEVHYE